MVTNTTLATMLHLLLADWCYCKLWQESFADLRFSAICGCWSGMVLQSAASPLPAPTPAHSNGSRGAAAAAAQAAPPVVGGTRLGGQEASSSS